ncbi:methyltransferase family protein [Neolewinella xylanilytica]|uniref:Methyltransferase family protein n=1 Tax=Neolewinella xylanilytica TaxID=1514080 RepID=A0A2S6I838_9BACT|nr:class I SAM-dependent methyltransferase [Neolewinella xylanilytica]PPK87652.1 methyltransferase family protein [Neolewinella xylanilytica]
MANDWLTLWNTRFGEPGYAYGSEPNVFLAAQLQDLPPGTILFGAEGEGRNAVYAAQRGWSVSAFDISAAGRAKALQLATDRGVRIDYRVGDLPELGYAVGQFDAVALIYAHFPPSVRTHYHALLHTYLKPGGALLFEAFGADHLAYRERDPEVGGPWDARLLFSVEDLRRDFPGYTIQRLAEEEVELREGKYHNGLGSVVRFVGRKPLPAGRKD